MFYCTRIWSIYPKLQLLEMRFETNRLREDSTIIPLTRIRTVMYHDIIVCAESNFRRLRPSHLKNNWTNKKRLDEPNNDVVSSLIQFQASRPRGWIIVRIHRVNFDS
ncbi:hypothetical protein V1478_016568 [Vespula squamosa]|uniref:Uncharacterized protein n=1 Tax=Vespula squamosa TaxID=30214 RepID=A0ABD2A070_VESSQ